MRFSMAAVLAGLASTALLAGGGAGGKAEVKGPHICCAQCVRVVNAILKDVPGVSDVTPDSKTKSVTFKAGDAKAAQAGVKALVDGGFFGSATLDGKEIQVDVPAPRRGEKSATVTVKDVHVCCGSCQKAINALFKDAKVTYEGKGPQRTVRIAGTDLDAGEVLTNLRKAGFNGTPE